MLRVYHFDRAEKLKVIVTFSNKLYLSIVATLLQKILSMYSIVLTLIPPY